MPDSYINSVTLIILQRVFQDVKSTTSFIQALNESLESGALMCQLYNAELNKYVMNLTNASRERDPTNRVRKKSRRMPRKAARLQYVDPQ